MSGFQKLVLLGATAALIICLAYPKMEYVSGYDRLVVNGIVVHNDVSTSKDRKYFREAEKPDHRVIYSDVFERAIAVIAISGVLLLITGIRSKPRNECN